MYTMDNEKTIKYENYISLGYFCEVAQDLEKMGLRNTSSPFDWCITSFEGIISLLANRFDGFMDYENLAQSIESRSHYLDTQYGVFFFHDFSKYIPLNEQIESVKEKYSRRINRFLNNIENPTLFIRYISNEIKGENGKSTELQWIEENEDYINKIVQMYNSQNNIIYIGDEKTYSNIVKIYNVKVDNNDKVSRSPIINNTELYPIMKEFKISGQEENIRRFEEKYQKKHILYTKFKRKIVSMYCKIFCKVYIHSKEYDIPDK